MSDIPSFEFSAEPEILESDIKLFIAPAGTGSSLGGLSGMGQPISRAVEQARQKIISAGFSEFGALKENIKIERKAGATKTNYKTSKATEANITLINCTTVNYDSAEESEGKRLDLVELDEANGMVKLFKNMEINVTETDENKKHPEIGFKLKNDSFSPTSRVIFNLMQ